MQNLLLPHFWIFGIYYLLNNFLSEFCPESWQITWWRIYWILSMNLKNRTYYIGMQLKKLMVYGFTIQTNVRKLQIFLTGMIFFDFSPFKLL